MIFLLIGFSLLVAIGFLIAFIWPIRSGQFEDEYTPSVRVLFEDEVVKDKEEKEDREDEEDNEEEDNDKPKEQTNN